MGISGEFSRNGGCMTPRQARRAAVEPVRSCRNTHWHFHMERKNTITCENECRAVPWLKYLAFVHVHFDYICAFLV